jgi:hypothetical protein
MTIDRERCTDRVQADARLRARRPGRTRVIKAAQIAFDGSVLDCVLLDISPNGAQVYLPAPVDVSDLVTLRLPDGEALDMRRRWRNGARIGFEFARTAPNRVLAGLVGANAAGIAKPM